MQFRKHFFHTIVNFVAHSGCVIYREHLSTAPDLFYCINIVVYLCTLYNVMTTSIAAVAATTTSAATLQKFKWFRFALYTWIWMRACDAFSSHRVDFFLRFFGIENPNFISWSDVQKCIFLSFLVSIICSQSWCRLVVLISNPNVGHLLSSHCLLLLPKFQFNQNQFVSKSIYRLDSATWYVFIFIIKEMKWCSFFC